MPARRDPLAPSPDLFSRVDRPTRVVVPPPFLLMLVTALLSQALLATAALAIPSSKERLAQRVARRANATAIPHHRQSNPKQIVPSLAATVAGILNSVIGEPSHTEFSSNWAGAVLIANTVSSYRAWAIHGMIEVIPLERVQLHLRYGQLHHPHSYRPRRCRSWDLLRICLGWHRRRYLRECHPPNRSRPHCLRWPSRLQWCALTLSSPSSSC